MAGEPELPDGLQVIARRDLAAGGQALGKEALVCVPQRREGRKEPRPEVDGEDERYSARAAATMASRSGTSASS
jgi:hypothetical protein